MHDEPQPGPEPQASAPKESGAPDGVRLDQYDKRQQELWRLTFFVLFVVTTVFAWLSWDTLRSTKFRLEALPFGLVVLVALLGVYVWKKTQEIAELKGLVRGLDQKDSAPVSDRTLAHLFQMISKSQQGFRDLIDSFDDILLALSLDGEIRSANRSFADFVGLPFQEIIGVPLRQLVSDWRTFGCRREFRRQRSALYRPANRFRRRCRRPDIPWWQGGLKANKPWRAGSAWSVGNPAADNVARPCS